MTTTQESNQIRIVIADDHPVFRRGLRAILESGRGIEIVAEAENGAVALEQIQDFQPAVAILDVDMPKADGVAVARAVKERNLPVGLVFLTMHKDESLFNAALEAGVKGYLIKDSALSEIASCVHAVAAGQVFISPELSSYLIKRRTRGDALRETRPGLSALTPAEKRVLRLIAESKTNKQIAEQLFVSIRTVEHHREHICEKLELKGSHALLSFAIEHKGFLD